MVWVHRNFFKRIKNFGFLLWVQVKINILTLIAAIYLKSTSRVIIYRNFSSNLSICLTSLIYNLFSTISSFNFDLIYILLIFLTCYTSFQGVIRFGLSVKWSNRNSIYFHLLRLLKLFTPLNLILIIENLVWLLLLNFLVLNSPLVLTIIIEILLRQALNKLLLIKPIDLIKLIFMNKFSN